MEALELLTKKIERFESLLTELKAEVKSLERPVTEYNTYLLFSSEKYRLEMAMLKFKGNRKKVAALLSMSERNVYRLLIKYKLS